MKIKNICFLLLLSFAGICAAANVTSIENDAEAAYGKGDYPKAISCWLQLVKEKGQSSELDYNLGNAYARGGDYGNAMLWYLRSLRLDPSNSDARRNVNFIDQKVADTNKAELKSKKLSVERDSRSFFSSVKYQIEANHLSDTWAYWASGFFIAFIICLALYLFAENVSLRKIGFFGGFSFLGLSVIGLIFAFMAAGYVSDEGVILSPKVKLHSDPNISSSESPVFLTRGTRMSILDKHPKQDSIPEWWKVRLNSDYVGWMSSKDFAPVEPN